MENNGIALRSKRKLNKVKILIHKKLDLPRVLGGLILPYRKDLDGHAEKSKTRRGFREFRG